MVNDMLDLGHLRSNTFKFNNKTFDLQDLAQKIVDVLIIQSKMKGLHLKMKIDSDVPKKVFSDPERLKQIIMNLIGNAIKYTTKGYVYLHLKVDPTYESDGNWKRLEISVRDTG
jgi:signal transduction histidine kinase